jgi:mitochondrial chaperone BCS1
MWYLSLAGIKSDTNLIKTIMNIKSKSVLLLEDIDVFHVATSRGESFAGTTLSGLLNALDGIATPHGLITIMTANRPKVLDSALIRPGRIDLVEHFGLSGPDEVTGLVRYWFELPANRKLQALPDDLLISMADATEICKRHNDAAGVMAALAQWKVQESDDETKSSVSMP